MSLPQDLLYLTNQIQGYTTNVFRLQTLSANTLSSDGAQQCTVSLPVTGICNMKSFAMHATVSTRGVPATSGSNAVYALLPKFDDLIDRFGVSCGGIALDNQTPNINLVKTVKDNLQKTADKFMSDDRVLNMSTLKPIDATNAWAVSHHGQKRHLVKNQWPGFFECEPAYLDLSKCPEIRVTIQLANKSVLPVQYEGKSLGDRTPSAANPNFTGSECEFSLENIYFTVEMVSVSGGMLEELNQRIISERGQLDVPYKQYNFFSTDISGVSGSLRSSVSTMSLDKVYACQRNASAQSGGGAPFDQYNVQQPPIEVDDNIGASHTTAQNTLVSSHMSNYKFTINNSPYPMFNPSPVDAFHLACVGNRRASSKDRGSLVASQDAWLGNFWTAQATLNHSDDVRTISGMNLSSVNAQISFEAAAGGDGNDYARQLCLITEQTSLLRVGAGRSVSVIA